MYQVKKEIFVCHGNKVPWWRTEHSAKTHRANSYINLGTESSNLENAKYELF